MEIKTIVDEIIQIENENRNIDFYYKRVEEIFNMITDNEFKKILKGNVEFLAELIQQYGYLDELVLNLFVFINGNACFKNIIDRETCMELGYEIEDKGYVVYERLIFYVEEGVGNIKRDLRCEIDFGKEVAFLIDYGKKVYYSYLSNDKKTKFISKNC